MLFLGFGSTVEDLCAACFSAMYLSFYQSLRSKPVQGIYPAKRSGVKLLVLAPDPGSSIAVTNILLPVHLINPISFAEIKRFLFWCVTRKLICLDCLKRLFLV